MKHSWAEVNFNWDTLCNQTLAGVCSADQPHKEAVFQNASGFHVWTPLCIGFICCSETCACLGLLSNRGRLTLGGTEHAARSVKVHGTDICLCAVCSGHSWEWGGCLLQGRPPDKREVVCLCWLCKLQEGKIEGKIAIQLLDLRSLNRQAEKIAHRDWKAVWGGYPFLLFLFALQQTHSDVKTKPRLLKNRDGGGGIPSCSGRSGSVWML